MPALSDAATAAVPSRRTGSFHAWLLVAVLVVTYVLSNVDRNVISLLVTPIKAELAIDDTRMSYLIGGGFAIFYVTAAIPLGVLADRMNRIRLIIAGVTLWSLATAACGLSYSYATLFLARIAVGVGEAVLTPCAQSIIADALPREKLGRAISLYAAGTPVGTGLALIGGGMIIDLAAGADIVLPMLGPLAPWRAIFVLLFFPGVLMVLMLALFREPARTRVSHDAERKGLIEGFRYLRNNRGVALNILAFATMATAAQGSFPWLPSFFERTYGVTAGEIGMPLGILAVVCGIVGLIVGGTIADTLFKRGRTDAHLFVGMIASVLIGPCLFAISFAPNMDIAFVCVGLLITIAGIPPGVAAAAVHIATPSRMRGVMASINLVITGLAAIALGPSLIAWLTDYVFGHESQLRYAFAVVSVLPPLAGIVFHLGRRSYRRTVEELVAAEARGLA